jgi:hypothetical protein
MAVAPAHVKLRKVEFRNETIKNVQVNKRTIWTKSQLTAHDFCIEVIKGAIANASPRRIVENFDSSIGFIGSAN